MLCKCGGELEINCIGFNGATGKCKVCGENVKLNFHQQPIKEPQFMFVRYRRKR